MRIAGTLAVCHAFAFAVHALPAFPGDGALRAAHVYCGANQPTAIALWPAGGAIRAFLTEKATGRVLLLEDGIALSVVLDLGVDSFGERGLLGIALHPDFATNSLVYLDFTPSTSGADGAAADGALDHRVVQFRWNGANLVQTRIVLQLSADAFTHVGGAIRFGPDGMLYGVSGDLGHGGVLQNVSAGPGPDDTSILFRVADDGTAPSDNPFFGLGGAMQKVFAFGIRNSFGFDFDPETGVLWDSENGAAHYDEVNRVAPGFNSGWLALMGPDARDPQDQTDLWPAGGLGVYADPEFSWLSPVSPTALQFVRGAALGAAYAGSLLVGTFSSRSILRFDLAPGREHLSMPDPTLQDRVADTAAENAFFTWAEGFDGGIVDLETGPDGALYAVVFESGCVVRITRSTLTDVRSPVSDLAARATPNPFRGSTRIEWTAAGSPRGWAVYSAAGRLVARLPASPNGCVWDGRDAAGGVVSPGVYFVRDRESPSAVKLVRSP